MLRDKNVTPYALQHAPAVHLISAGVNVTVTLSWLGHVSLDTTIITPEPTSKQSAGHRSRSAPPSNEPPTPWKRAPSVLALFDTLN